MKKLMIVAALFVCTLSFAKANDDNPTAKAESTFAKIFLGVSNAKWKTVGDFSVAVFTLNGHAMKAFFNEDGQLVSTTRILTSKKELPEAALNNLENTYPGWGMTDLIEESGKDNDSCYYARITDGKVQNIVKISKAGKVSLFKTE